MTNTVAIADPSLLTVGRDAFGIGQYTYPSGGSGLGIVFPGGSIVELRGAVKVIGHVRGVSVLQSATTLEELLLDWERGFEALRVIAQEVAQLGDDERLPRHQLGQVKVHSPLSRPSKMINAAQNYPDHVEEMRQARGRGFNSSAIDEAADFKGEKDTAKPYMFLKAPSSITGAYDDIWLPRGTEQIDWEVELAVVIGRRTRHASAAGASASIAGYMTTNDVSCRDMLFRPDRERLRSDWLGGKSHDGFAPMGPCFVPYSFVPDHNDLELELSVNGELKQSGSTANLIFSPEEQIEWASRIMTLHPGDILATGTPGGVGQGSDTFLKHGDIVEARVGHLGTIRNTFVEEL